MPDLALDDSATERAAQTLWQAWTDGELLGGLPPDASPKSLGDAYAIQLAMDRLAGLRVGWKLAATGAGGRSALGVDQPLAGPLYARFQLPPTEHVRFSSIRMQTIEGEFGLMIKDDLRADAGPFDRTMILEAIGAFVPVIEIPNTRYLAHRSAGAALLTADSACAGFFVLGDPTTDFDASSLPDHPISLVTPNGTIEGTGAKVLGDPVEAVRWLANELAGYGQHLRAGDCVITGAAAATKEPGTGKVTAEFGPLGRATITLD